MKKVIAYGLRFEDETLEKVAKVYVGGATAYGTKKDALYRMKEYKKDSQVDKNEKITLVRFVVEDVR